MGVHCIILSTLGMLAKVHDKNFRKFCSRGSLWIGNAISTEKVWPAPSRKLGAVEHCNWKSNTLFLVKRTTREISSAWESIDCVRVSPQGKVLFKQFSGPDIERLIIDSTNQVITTLFPFIFPLSLSKKACQMEEKINKRERKETGKEVNKVREKEKKRRR